MASPDRSLLVCPECGAVNRAGETACFLCGHRLDTTWTESTIGARDPSASSKPPPLVNPRGAAEAPSTPRPTFRISSLMLLIVLVAVCAAVWHEQPILGMILTVAVTPALAYTFVVAYRSATGGKPMAVFEKVWTFVVSLAGVFVIAVSALIAFVVTCVPAGFVTINSQSNSFFIPLAIGGTAGVAVAARVTYYLLTRKRRTARTAGKP